MTLPKTSLALLAAALSCGVALPARAEMAFNRIATFPVASNLPADADKSKPTSSEIITAKTPHAILHVDEKGKISEEIGFPDELMAFEIRYGLEGITAIGEGDDLMLVAAMQREWRDDPKGQVKLLAYKPKAKEWSAVRYELDATDEGWVGLSEVTAHDGRLFIVERDNLVGEAAKVKRVYSVAIDTFKPASLGGELPVVEKTLVRDLLPDLKAATNGYVVDKVEGFTIDAAGNAYRRHRQ